jgi:hypothetical protein
MVSAYNKTLFPGKSICNTEASCVGSACERAVCRARHASCTTTLWHVAADMHAPSSIINETDNEHLKNHFTLNILHKYSRPSCAVALLLMYTCTPKT